MLTNSNNKMGTQIRVRSSPISAKEAVSIGPVEELSVRVDVEVEADVFEVNGSFTFRTMVAEWAKEESPCYDLGPSTLNVISHELFPHRNRTSNRRDPEHQHVIQ